MTQQSHEWPQQVDSVNRQEDTQIMDEEIAIASIAELSNPNLVDKATLQKLAGFAQHPSPRVMAQLLTTLNGKFNSKGVNDKWVFAAVGFALWTSTLSRVQHFVGGHTSLPVNLLGQLADAADKLHRGKRPDWDSLYLSLVAINACINVLLAAGIGHINNEHYKKTTKVLEAIKSIACIPPTVIFLLEQTQTQLICLSLNSPNDSQKSSIKNEMGKASLNIGLSALYLGTGLGELIVATGVSTAFPPAAPAAEAVAIVSFGLLAGLAAERAFQGIKNIKAIKQKVDERGYVDNLWLALNIKDNKRHESPLNVLFDGHFQRIIAMLENSQTNSLQLKQLLFGLFHVLKQDRLEETKVQAVFQVIKTCYKAHQSDDKASVGLFLLEQVQQLRIHYQTNHAGDEPLLLTHFVIELANFIPNDKLSTVGSYLNSQPQNNCYYDIDFTVGRLSVHNHFEGVAISELTKEQINKISRGCNDREAPPMTTTGTSEVLRNKNIIGTRFNFSFLNNAEEAVTLYRGVTETNREDDKQRKKDKNPKQTRVLNKTDEEVICGDKNIINTDFTNVTDPINDPLADFSNVSLRDKAISKDINNLTAHTVNFIGNYKHCSPAMSGGLPAQRGEASPYLLLEQTLLAFYQDYGRVPYLFQDEPLASQRCFELGTNYIQLHLVENPANNAAQNERSAFSPVKLTRCGECTVATLLKPMQWPRGPTIVFGQAGMGKSTLSQYMAYLWSQRNSISDCPVGLAECEIVFYLPLRYLKRYRPSEAFKPGAMTDDILAGVLLFLFRQLYPQKTLEAERGDKLSVSMLATLVKERADSVLFIVDGLDEITTELKDSQGFHHQFVRYLLLQPRVMLTSRPIVIQPSLLPVKQQKEDCRWLEVKGFHEDSMNAYISDYFGQRGEDLVSKGEQLQCYLNNNALLFDICHTPINLALLCVVWEEDKTLLQAPPGPDIKPEVKQDKDVTTPSFNTIDIYQRLLLFLQRRYVKRSLALQPNAVDCINKFNEKTLDEQQAYIQTYCADLMDFLMVLATYGMTHDELAFSGDTLTNLLEQQAPLLRKFYQRLPSAYQHSLKKQHEPLPGEPPVSKHRLQQIAFLQGLREFGLLAFASPGGNLAGQEIWFSFLHLSFQEYLAAHHLVARLRRCLEDRRDPQQDSAIRWTVVRYKYEPRYRRFWQFVMGEVSQDNLLFAAIEALRCGVLPIKHWGVQDSEANERIEQDLKNCWLSGVSAQADNAVKQTLVSRLQQGLSHPNAKVRKQALELLEALPPGFTDNADILTGLLEHLIEHESASLQCDILCAIALLGAPLATHEAIIKRVIAGLESDNWAVQRAAQIAVNALGAPLVSHEAFIKRIIAKLESNNIQVQRSALGAVEVLGAPLATREAVIMGVIAGLESNNPEVQRTAWRAVAALGASLAIHEAVIKYIIAGLASDNLQVRQAARQVVMSLDASLATREAVIKRVITGLVSGNLLIQCTALYAVSVLGAPLATHEAVIKGLIAGLVSGNWQVQHAALMAVRALDAPLATHDAFIKSLIAGLESDNWQVRYTALEVVRVLRVPLATREAVIKGLIAGLTSSDWKVQDAALQAVWALRAPLATHEAVIMGIIAGLVSEHMYVQRTALEVVIALGTALATNQMLINSLLVMLASDSRELQPGQSKVVAALDAILGHSVLTYCLSNAKLSQAAHQWSPKAVIQRYLCQTQKKFMLYVEKHSSCYLVLDDKYGAIDSVHSVPLTCEEFTLLLSLTDGHNLLFPTTHTLSGHIVVRPTEGSNATAEKVDNAIDHRPVFKPSSTEIAASLCEADNAKCILPALHDSHYDNIIQPVTIKKSNVFKDFSRYLTSAEKTQLKDALTVINELLVDMDIGDESGDKASLMRLSSSLLSKATDLAEFDISQEGAQAYLASIIQTMEEIEKAQQVQATFFR